MESQGGGGGRLRIEGDEDWLLQVDVLQLVHPVRETDVPVALLEHVPAGPCRLAARHQRRVAVQIDRIRTILYRA